MGSVVRDCRCKRIAVHSSAVCLRPIQRRRCQETSDLPACNLEMYKYVKYGGLLGHRFPHSDVSSVAAKPACLPTPTPTVLPVYKNRLRNRFNNCL